MIIIKDYKKPQNCYDCPGYSNEHYYCKFAPSIDFDKHPLEPVPPDCPIVEFTPEQMKYGEWIQVDDTLPLAYDCSNCVAMVRTKYKYCPRCGSYMINGEQYA